MNFSLQKLLHIFLCESNHVNIFGTPTYHKNFKLIRMFIIFIYLEYVLSISSVPTFVSTSFVESVIKLTIWRRIMTFFKFILIHSKGGVGRRFQDKRFITLCTDAFANWWYFSFCSSPCSNFTCVFSLSFSAHSINVKKLSVVRFRPSLKWGCANFISIYSDNEILLKHSLSSSE